MNQEQDFEYHAWLNTLHTERMSPHAFETASCNWLPAMKTRVEELTVLRAQRKNCRNDRAVAYHGDPLVSMPDGYYLPSIRAMLWKEYGHLVWYVSITQERGHARKYHITCDDVNNPRFLAGVIVGRFTTNAKARNRVEQLIGRRLYAIASVDIDEDGTEYGNIPLFVGTHAECKRAWNFVATHWGCQDGDITNFGSEFEFGIRLMPISMVVETDFNWMKEY